LLIPTNIAAVLTDAHRREIPILVERYGTPRVEIVDLGINRFAHPGDQRGRPGEVCMVIRRPSHRLLVFRKTFYLPGIYRLPTGGIRADEGIFQALERELYEETGLGIAAVRFLSLVAYRTTAGGADPVTVTYAFLLDDAAGIPVPVDPDEQVEEFKDVEIDDLLSIADHLDRLAPRPAPDLESDWHDWGRFRAVIHRIVWEQLNSR
jgi:8-oxo-dGTP pyrophosphatase MutT (NUDIX family)